MSHAQIKRSVRSRIERRCPGGPVTELAGGRTPVVTGHRGDSGPKTRKRHRVLSGARLTRPPLCARATDGTSGATETVRATAVGGRRERERESESEWSRDGKNAREPTAEAAETKPGTLAAAGYGDGTTTSFGRHLVYHTEPFPQDTVLFLITRTHYTHTRGSLCRLRNLHTHTRTRSL